MRSPLSESFFSELGQWITDDPLIETLFQDHSCLQKIKDIIHRKEQHHVRLIANNGDEIFDFYIDALMKHLHQESSSPFSQSSWLKLDLENILSMEIKQATIEKDFEQLRHYLSDNNPSLVLVLTRSDLFFRESKKHDDRISAKLLWSQALKRKFAILADHPRVRLLLLSSEGDDSNHHITNIFLPPLTENDEMNILKRRCKPLETYYQLTIPYALHHLSLRLAKHYLHRTQYLKHALLLLDSALSRKQNNPIELTRADVLRVLSDWIHVPLTHLEVHREEKDCATYLSKEIIGQEMASVAIAHALTSKPELTHNRSSSFFVFIGPQGVGKKMAVLSLAKYLYGTSDPFYIAQLSGRETHWSEIQLQQYDNQQLRPITTIIKQIPFAIILFDVESCNENIKQDLKTLCIHGTVVDTLGERYHFEESLIILNMSCPHEKIPHTEDDNAISKFFTGEQDQTVLLNNARMALSVTIEKQLTKLIKHFPASFYQQATIVPFLPLKVAAIEKIIRIKLKQLGQHLQSRRDIDLGYAPEVIRYLTQYWVSHAESPVFHPSQLFRSLDVILQTASQNKNSNHSNQLFLQLDEKNVGLYAEWLPMETLGEHTD